MTHRAYLEQLLDVDAAVIGDNATHIIVTLRLSKRTISENHQLLVALSELAHREVETPRRGWCHAAAAAGVGAAAIFQWLPGKAIAAFMRHPAALTVNWLLTLHEVVS